MSPKSRRRKLAKTIQRRPRPQDRAQRPRQGRLREPGLREAYAELIESMRALADPAQVPDAYEAEVAVSVLLGTMFQAGLRGELLASALQDVASELARGDPAHGFPALRTLAVVGPPEISGYAGQAAGRLAVTAERAGQTPSWTGALGQVTPGTCTIARDAYRETQVVLCEFVYPDGARPHGVFAVIDATCTAPSPSLS